MFQNRLNQIKSILCLGAHADDIEIGCGGTLLRLIAEHPGVEVRWIVFSASEARRAEANTSAQRFLVEAGAKQIVVHNFRDSFFPVQYEAVKGVFHDLAGGGSPDLIFTHRRDDAHQDHRVLADLTWCAFRNHLILEYEIPKYEGDLGQPNVFVPLDETTSRKKVSTIVEAFPTQQAKPWFAAETFFALMKIRGIECHAPGGYAEGFYCRKMVI